VNPYQQAQDHLFDLTADRRDGGSEFGGVGGDPQPYPHEPSPSETLHAMYGSDNPGALIHTDEAAPSVHPRGDN
jgi:hypothetical protein